MILLVAGSLAARQERTVELSKAIGKLIRLEAEFQRTGKNMPAELARADSLFDELVEKFESDAARDYIQGADSGKVAGYQFRVNTEGRWTVLMEDETGAYVLQSWAANDALDATGWTLAVLARGDTFSFWANGALLGTPLGVLILVRADETLLRLLVATSVFVSAVVTLATGNGHPHEARPEPLVRQGAVGIMGGVIRGAVSMGGPPIVLYQHWIGGGADRIRGSLTAYFFWVGIPATAMTVPSGVFTSHVIRNRDVLPDRNLATVTPQPVAADNRHGLDYAVRFIRELEAKFSQRNPQQRLGRKAFVCTRNAQSPFAVIFASLHRDDATHPGDAAAFFVFINCACRAFLAVLLSRSEYLCGFPSLLAPAT